MSKSLETKIILKGVTDPSLSKAFQNASKLADNNLDTLAAVGGKIKTVAKVAAGAAVGAGVASAKAAIDYESAFAGVMKTVDETANTSYADLSAGIRQMAKEMPASASEIAAVAESAGQLGIKADDVLNFTKTMIDLGESTNLSSEDAATEIAKLFNVTGTSMDEVGNFGATLVALGNNAATTEADIMNMASRIGATGSQIGLTDQNILALATSLSSVGMEAEAGGTAISTVMAQIDKDVATNAESLGTWAKTAGMSTEEFSKMWETDAYGALQSFIKGMATTQDEGGNLNLLLEDLGITGIRTSDTMKRLANASELMSDMTVLADKSWEENTALTEEAGKRYATMASKIEMIKNKFTDVGITIGQAMMPYLEKFADWLMTVDFDAIIQKIADFGKKLKDWLPVFAALAGAFAAIKILAFVKGIITVIKVIATLAKSFGLISTLMAVLGGPVTIVIALIGALVGAFIYLWNTSEKFRNFWKGLWKNIKDFASKAVSKISDFFSKTLPQAIETAVNWFKSLPEKIGTWLTNTKEKVGTWASEMWSKAVEAGSNFISAIGEWFSQLPSKIWNWLVEAAGKAGAWIVDMWGKATTAGAIFLTTIGTWFSQLPSKIWTWLVEAVGKAGTWVSEMWGKAVSAGSQFLSAIATWFSQLPSKIWTLLTEAVTKAGEWIPDFVAKATQAGEEFFSGIVNKVSEIPDEMLSIGASIVSNIWSGISGGIQTLYDNIASFASELKGKIASLFGGTGGEVSSAAGGFGGGARHFATGGTVTTPQYAVVGDAPETIVPHGNTAHNRELLQEAARGVGVGFGTSVNITFAPVVNGGNASENRQMLEDEAQVFEQKMNEYFNGKARVAFG